jgi:hypothetical protein
MIDESVYEGLNSATTSVLRELEMMCTVEGALVGHNQIVPQELIDAIVESTTKLRQKLNRAFGKCTCDKPFGKYECPSYEIHTRIFEALRITGLAAGDLPLLSPELGEDDDSGDYEGFLARMSEEDYRESRKKRRPFFF